MIQKIVALLLVVGLCSLIGCVNKKEYSLISDKIATSQSKERPTSQHSQTSKDEVEGKCKIYIGTNGEFKEYSLTKNGLNQMISPFFIGIFKLIHIALMLIIIIFIL